MVLIGHQDSIIFERAFGNRSVEPELEAMTTDTVFDLASLTKVVATAPSVMLLVQKGLLKLDEPVSKYLPAFGQIWEEEGNRAPVVSALLGPSRRLFGKPDDAESLQRTLYPVSTKRDWSRHPGNDSFTVTWVLWCSARLLRK